MSGKEWCAYESGYYMIFHEDKKTLKIPMKLIPNELIKEIGCNACKYCGSLLNSQYKVENQSTCNVLKLLDECYSKGYKWC